MEEAACMVLVVVAAGAATDVKVATYGEPLAAAGTAPAVVDVVLAECAATAAPWAVLREVTLAMAAAALASDAVGHSSQAARALCGAHA